MTFSTIRIIELFAFAYRHKIIFTFFFISLSLVFSLRLIIVRCIPWSQGFTSSRRSQSVRDWIVRRRNIDPVESSDQFLRFHVIMTKRKINEQTKQDETTQNERNDKASWSVDTFLELVRLCQGVSLQSLSVHWIHHWYFSMKYFFFFGYSLNEH